MPPSTSTFFPPDVISDILPAEEVSILAGASGAGKTTLLMQIVRHLQRGQDVFGHAAQPGLKIGYVAADRTWISYHKLATRVGVDLSTLRVRALVDDDDIDTEHFEQRPLRLLMELLESMLPLDLIVVDPLIVFIGCDTRIYHVNAARLMMLNKWCRGHHATILGTHHAVKARTDWSYKRAQDRISGTAALLGFTSTQLFLAAPDELGEGRLFHEWTIVSHHAAAKTIFLERTSQGLFVAASPDALHLVQDLTYTQPALPAVTRLLTQLLEAGPQSRQSLITALSDIASVPTVDRALKALLDAKIICRDSRGVYQKATH